LPAQGYFTAPAGVRNAASALRRDHLIAVSVAIATKTAIKSRAVRQACSITLTGIEAHEHSPNCPAQGIAHIYGNKGKQFFGRCQPAVRTISRSEPYLCTRPAMLIVNVRPGCRPVPDAAFPA
jgi:hypothetical protein